MSYQRIPVPQDVSRILDVLWNSGFPAYVVGGCVRDSLLGRKPGDWDICTAATPGEMRRAFAGERLVPTGEKHGTMTLVRCGVPYEITSFRSDGAYSDARHPDSVELGATLAQDLARRDFTVNAMAFSPRGGFVDYFGGSQDLRSRVLRCVGDPRKRLSEDALRVARAARFAAQLGFAVEEKTAEAASELCGRLADVSPERVRAELEKLLCGACAGAALRLYGAWFSAVLPPIPTWAGDAVAACPADLPTRLAVLAHACGDGFLYTLRFPREAALAASAVAAYLASPPKATAESARRVLHRLGPRGAQTFAAAWTAVCAARPAETDAREAAAFWRETQQALARGDCYSLAQMAVTGADALEAGVQPGRSVGRVLSRLLDEVMQGVLPNERSALLARLRSMMQEERAER